MSSVQLLSSFGMCSRVLRKLLETDFIYTIDVQDLTPAELSSASGLDSDECAEVIRLVSNPLWVQSRSVLQLLDDEDKYIVTFCKGLDDVLGGGLPVGAITEVIGPPGIGKTQLCLQVCIAAQLPTSIGGLNGEVVYIDTEGSFSSGRLKEIALHAIQHLKAVNALTSDEIDFTADSVLSHVHYFRCHSLFEVVATTKYISVLQEENKKIKLIIVDSMALPIQQDSLDYRMHRQLQYHIAQELAGHAITFDLAILLVSHLMEDKGNDSLEHPVVGVHESKNFMSKESTSHELESYVTEKSVGKSYETWSPYIDVKIVFDWEAGVRVARLVKSPHGSNILTKFQVTAGGIRDLIEDETSVTDAKIQSTSSINSEEQISKKRKLENLTFE
ncbi:DNA repair protein RAD51 homolog 3-like [Palaemon carinicauda]|uniref:DNA repair protein RAD51 homolog 3-like n=1 Tax=Palaemon carinicauda TaxID=392227 RepID=UPI0035B59F12